MKIIEWNCQGAFRIKNKKILTLNPDIIIVPECENEKKLQFGKLTPKPNDFFWYGDSENRGIGVFSYSEYRFKIHESFNPGFRYIIPLKVTGKNVSFLLFAIWAMNNKDNREARYIGQIWFAINYYSHLLNGLTILIGDFNSNRIWDYKDRVGNHSDVVDKLKEFDIFSLYHEQYKENQGQETTPTFYMYRKPDKPYHIDYCFVSKSIMGEGYDFKVGEFTDWIDKSDHMPIIVDTRLKNITL